MRYWRNSSASAFQALGVGAEPTYRTTFMDINSIEFWISNVRQIVQQVTSQPYQRHVDFHRMNRDELIAVEQIAAEFHVNTLIQYGRRGFNVQLYW